MSWKRAVTWIVGIAITVDLLMVLTDRGDFILDNKTNAVLPWSDTPYDYHKREGAEGLAWVALSHQRAPVVTAAKGATSLR